MSGPRRVLVLIKEEDPKVRSAAIRHVWMILSQALAVSSGLTPDPHTEDAMKSPGQ